MTDGDWSQRGFRWRDGERLVRFGGGSRRELLELLAAERLAPFALVTTERAAAMLPEAAASAVRIAHVPPGGVPEAGLAAEQELFARGEPGVAGLLALGGGRVIDVAKAVAAAHALPCAAAPTTLSGAELSAFHRPLGDGRGAGPNRPRLVVTDPALAASQPVPGLTASALNAFAHAMEAVYGPGAGPVTSAAAAGAAGRLVRGLEGVQRDAGDEGARSQLALGALLAGYAIGATGLGLHHVLSQTVVRHSGAPHALVNAVMAPHVLDFMLRAAPGPLAPIADALGESDDLDPAALHDEGPDPVAHLRRVAAGCGVRRLRELGVGEEELPGIVRLAARRPELASTPGSPGEAECLALLRAAW